MTHAGRVAPLKIGEVRILSSTHEKRGDPTGRADHDAAQEGLGDFLESVPHEEDAKAGPHDRNRHDDERDGLQRPLDGVEEVGDRLRAGGRERGLGSGDSQKGCGKNLLQKVAFHGEVLMSKGWRLTVQPRKRKRRSGRDALIPKRNQSVPFGNSPEFFFGSSV